jgi:hypothetical protein
MSQTADLKIIRRDDLIPPAINLKYRVTVSSGSQKSVQVIHDICGNIPLAAGGNAIVEGIGYVGDLESLAQFVTGSGTIDSTDQATLQSFARRPGTPAATIDLEGPNTTYQPLACFTLPVIPDGDSAGQLEPPGSDSGFWAQLFPDLAGQASVAFAEGIPPTVVVKSSGSAVDLTTYPYWVIGGGVANWMLNGSGGAGLVVVATVIASLSYSDQDTEPGSTTPTIPTGKTASHPRTADIVLTNLPTGLYSTVTPGEVIPYGLAGFIYNIESIPQYQGNYTIQEQDITDQCPMGNNLNLTGSLAEWATMNATVQEIEYDLDGGRTTLTFGPAAHLGAQDFVERLRVNRGPRWFYLNGNNSTNAPNPNSAASNTAFKDGNTSSKTKSVEVVTGNLADIHTHASAYTKGFPGVTTDCDPASSTNYGNLSVQGHPLIFLSAGTGGALAGYIMHETGTPSIQMGIPADDDSFAYLSPTGGGVLAVGTDPDSLSSDVPWIMLNVADLGDAVKQLRVREIQVCVSTDGGETYTNMYMLVIGSKPYTVSTGINLTP